jgi:hypothetical protein
MGRGMMAMGRRMWIEGVGDFLLGIYLPAVNGITYSSVGLVLAR